MARDLPSPTPFQGGADQNFNGIYRVLSSDMSGTVNSRLFCAVIQPLGTQVIQFMHNSDLAFPYGFLHYLQRTQV
jgi:hypothetical protein